MVKQKTKALTVKKRLHRHLKLAVVPHKANDFRPHAVRRYGILAILVLVFAVQAMYNGMTSGNVLGSEAHITAAGLLEETNQARAERGEELLTLNDELSRAANLKARDMLAQQYWSHTSPDGKAPWGWFADVGYDYAYAGENLAKNFTSSAGVVTAWLNSPSHRENVLKEQYRDVGFAIVDGVLEGRQTSLVVALYGAQTPAVQGVAATKAPSVNQSIGFIARIGAGIQSLTPAAVGGVAILLLAALVALMAHFYRKKLPVALRRSWYRHHGIYKAIGFTSVAVILILAYGGTGQI